MCSMKNPEPSEIVITGVGVTSAIGQGRDAFVSSLMEGRHAFGVMQRPGRQNGTSFIGAEKQSLVFPDTFSKRLLRTASLSGKAALVTLQEAWDDAALNGIEPDRVGLVIGGSNVQQREQIQAHQSYENRVPFLSPTYGLSFMDSDLCGYCTEQFSIRGFAHTVGGASASGQLAVIQAAQAVLSGQADICIAMVLQWVCKANSRFRSRARALVTPEKTGR